MIFLNDAYIKASYNEIKHFKKAIYNILEDKLNLLKRIQPYIMCNQKMKTANEISEYIGNIFDLKIQKDLRMYFSFYVPNKYPVSVSYFANYIFIKKFIKVLDVNSDVLSENELKYLNKCLLAPLSISNTETYILYKNILYKYVSEYSNEIGMRIPHGTISLINYDDTVKFINENILECVTDKTLPLFKEFFEKYPDGFIRIE